jgi:hypothetical protein
MQDRRLNPGDGRLFGTNRTGCPDAKRSIQHYAHLVANERQGIDCSIVSLDRLSPVTIITPHGGQIEPPTSALAMAIAANDYTRIASMACAPVAIMSCTSHQTVFTNRSAVN